MHAHISAWNCWVTSICLKCRCDVELVVSCILKVLPSVRLSSTFSSCYHGEYCRRIGCVYENYSECWSTYQVICSADLGACVYRYVYGIIECSLLMFHTALTARSAYHALWTPRESPRCVRAITTAWAFVPYSRASVHVIRCQGRHFFGRFSVWASIQ